MSFKEYMKFNVESGIDTFYADTPQDRTMSKTQEEVSEILSIMSKKPANSAEIAKKTAQAPISNDNSANSDSRRLANSAKNLAELKEIVQNFNGCPLKLTATNTVFADGSEKAKIMLIGEAPGANEDLEGIPFCGQSGKLLNNILLSIGLKREDVYITNTVFWRPPANRRPTAEELSICRPFVEKHIALLNPQVILLVGATAVEALLGAESSMHDIRAEYRDYKNEYMEKSIKTAVIFHPSYLLRQPQKKKLMWFDMLKIKALIS